jgi:hypothetical protein
MWITVALLVVAAFVVGYGVATWNRKKKIRVVFTVGPITQK